MQLYSYIYIYIYIYSIDTWTQPRCVTWRPLPYNRRQSKETGIHSPGAIRTRDPSKRAAENPQLRLHGHWNRLCMPYGKKYQNFCALRFTRNTTITTPVHQHTHKPPSPHQYTSTPTNHYKLARCERTETFFKHKDEFYNCLFYSHFNYKSHLNRLLLGAVVHEKGPHTFGTLSN
jgi:hypothetical protein